jgi:hypothetical protein
LPSVVVAQTDQWAVDDFGGTMNGKKINILNADTQLKADIASRSHGAGATGIYALGKLFFWNWDESTRAFAKRFAETFGNKSIAESCVSSRSGASNP